jgi:hypothetical protein
LQDPLWGQSVSGGLGVWLDDEIPSCILNIIGARLLPKLLTVLTHEYVALMLAACLKTPPLRHVLYTLGEGPLQSPEGVGHVDVLEAVVVGWSVLPLVAATKPEWITNILAPKV